VEKDYGGGFILREGRTWRIGRVKLQWNLQCTGGLRGFGLGGLGHPLMS
jgi:hypothetical protein